MSWQTPAPCSQASIAPVFTPVAPGMYETWSVTMDETATAVPWGSRPVDADLARSTSSCVTVVRVVGDAYSRRREFAVVLATSAQVGAGSAGPVGPFPPGSTP